MRKMISLLIGIVMLGVLVSGYAQTVDEVDLSVFSDDELVALGQRIYAEIVERKIEKTAHLSAGEYIGGTDIPVGTYILLIDNTEGKSPIQVRFITKPINNLYGSVSAGQAHQELITVYENDRLTVNGSFDLTISVKGIVNFD